MFCQGFVIDFGLLVDVAVHAKSDTSAGGASPTMLLTGGVVVFRPLTPTVAEEVNDSPLSCLACERKFHDHA
jgi:hypothetical protein